MRGQPSVLSCISHYDKLNRDGPLSISFWPRDACLEESDNLPDLDVCAQEMVEDLEAALEQFREIAANLTHEVPTEKNQIDER